MASPISLSLSHRTTPLKLNSKSLQKCNLTPQHFRILSCRTPSYSSSSNEISLKLRSSFDQPTVPISCRRQFDFLPRCGISSNDFPTEKKKSFGEWVEFVGEAVSTAFPIWVTLGCLLGLMKPTSFNWVTPNMTIIGLTITMLGMGMTLTLDDLRGALSMPKELFAGFLLQYSVGLPLNAIRSLSID